MPYFCLLSSSSKKRTPTKLGLGKASHICIGFLEALPWSKNGQENVFQSTNLHQKNYFNLLVRDIITVSQGKEKSRTKKF